MNKAGGGGDRVVCGCVRGGVRGGVMMDVLEVVLVDELEGS